MLNKFISYLEEQAANHSIYVWGAQGQTGDTITEAWIRSREKTKRNARRAIAFWKKQVKAGYGNVLRAFDCSGLGVYFLLKEGLIKSDMTANGLMGKCAKITRAQLKRGDFVFKVNSKGRAYHVGYVVDDGLNVIETKGRDYGVVKSKLKGWNAYGRPPFFGESAEQTKSRVLKRMKPYMCGADVLELQTTLKNKGYAVGPLDGIFGPKTEKAVRAFQKDAKLVVDGKAGPKTHAALGMRYV
jgi:hypothetical protein